MLRWPDSVSKEGCVFFEPPEWLCITDELDLRDGVFIPKTSTGAAPSAVPKQGGISGVFRDVRSDDEALMFNGHFYPIGRYPPFSARLKPILLVNAESCFLPSMKRILS